MSTAVEAPQQHKQPSRKGKKAWRKNVDISEVQQGLDTVREEVIKGGIIAEKPSTSLFTVDTTGSASIRKTVLKTRKPLKADEILAQRSAIPAVDSRKRPASSRITDGLVEPSSKKRKSGGVSHKELERLKRIAYGGDAVPRDVVQASENANHDPWAVEEQPRRDPRFSFLEEKKAVRAPRTLKHAPVSLAASGKAIPAIRKPEAGKSYNPLYEDYQALIDREGEKEVEAEKKRLKEAQEEAERLERAIAAAEAEEREHESAWESEWESEWEGFQSEAEEAEKLKQKRPERKTPAERNKIKRRKEAERLARHEARRKEKEQQARRVRELAKEVEAKERTRAQALVLARDKVSSDEEEVLRRRQFGKAPVPEAPLEVVLEDELEDSLRLLKPEGNLLTDRYRSMLLRGKVETRRRVTQHKKAKTTVTEKWSYKDWKLPTR